MRSRLRDDCSSLSGVTAHDGWSIGLDEKDAGSRGDALIGSNIFGNVLGSSAQSGAHDDQLPLRRLHRRVERDSGS